jgi:hypothetical protein
MQLYRRIHMATKMGLIIFKKSQDDEYVHSQGVLTFFIILVTKLKDKNDHNCQFLWITT